MHAISCFICFKYYIEYEILRIDLIFNKTFYLVLENRHVTIKNKN